MIVGAITGARALSTRFARCPATPAAEVKARDLLWNFMAVLRRRAGERNERVRFVFGDAPCGIDEWALEYAYAQRDEHRVFHMDGRVTGWDAPTALAVHPSDTGPECDGAEVDARWAAPGVETGPLPRNDAMARELAGYTAAGDLVVLAAYAAPWADTHGTAHTATRVLKRCAAARLRAFLWTVHEDGTSVRERLPRAGRRGEAASPARR